jgi:hypothetical protein
VLRLDQIQDERQLTEEECHLRTEAKNKILALAAVRRIRLRQRSRLTWIRAGDASTKLFHLRANARRRRNHISGLRHEGHTCITQEAKATALDVFFSQQFGHTNARNHTLNWELLGQNQCDLLDLERDVTEEEIFAAVMQIHSEKAPGPDGCTGAFFKACWSIIKADLVAAIQEIFALRSGCWNLFNSAHIVLIEKKEAAEEIGDYRPISMLHSVAKILAKIMAARLAPHLDQLVSHSQSDFIKGRSIHDNFQYVKGAANHFHNAKAPMLLLKLDIAKAFDNVR